MLWANIMNSLRKGILGLKLYNPETGKWGQAHTQGNYVFGQFLLEKQKSPIVQVELNEEAKDFRIKVDKELLYSEGREIITLFLSTLNAYKSAGASQVANEFYAKYSAVDDKFLKVREFVVAANIPRRIELNNNLRWFSQDEVHVQQYPECFEGIILSFADRFSVTHEFKSSILAEWERTASQLRVQA